MNKENTKYFKDLGPIIRGGTALDVVLSVGGDFNIPAVPILCQ